MKKKTNTVEIVTETVTAIRVGKDVCTIKPTNDGRGLRIENKSGGIFIPFGAEGKAIVDTMKRQVDSNDGVSKGHRRTRTRIEAQKALVD